MRDLLQDQRALAVSQVALYFNAAIDRPGMHHDRVRFELLEPRAGQAEGAIKLAGRRDVISGHALALQPQQHHHVGAVQSLVQVVAGARAQAFNRRWHQRAGSHRADFLHPQGAQRVDVRARHARVQDVSDNRHGEIPKIFLARFQKMAADGEHIQQRLGRVRVAAIAGVEHRYTRRGLLREEMRRAADRMPDHEHVHLHRLQRGQGVQQRFALGGRGGGHVEVDHVRRQTLGRQFERGTGTGAGLEKQVDHGLAVQQRVLFLAPAGEFLRAIQNTDEMLA